MKKTLALLMALMTATSLAACANTSTPATSSTASSAASAASSEATSGSPDAVATSGEIVIGCLQDVTGATSSLGQMVQAGAQWAVDEINAQGGVNGKKLVMNTYDTKGDVTEAVNAFTKAVTSDKVKLIVGPPVANIANAIKETSETYDVPVVGLALDPTCQIKADGSVYKNMFCFQPSATSQGAIMASYAMKNNFKNFGILYNESNAYSLSLLDPFKDAAAAGGGTIAKEVAYNANDTDFKTLLSPIVSAGVDAIFVPNYTKDLINITTAARALGFEGALICGLDACPPFNTLYGGDCSNIYFINNVDDTTQELKDMIAAVKEKTNIDATNKFFLGYDIVHIAAQALTDVGEDDMDAMRSYLEGLKDFNGLTGSISIDPATHMPTGLEMFMFTYKDNLPVMLEQYAA